MRIVGGAWRGRTLIAPAGQGTRPTADRVRQGLFDILMHAEWGGRQLMEGAVVLDVFAGTGALGLEALSRGAAQACFIESDPAALRALRANVLACGAEGRAKIMAEAVGSAGRLKSNVAPPGPASLVFLDPPYGGNLVPKALSWLREKNWTKPDAVILAETGREEDWRPAQSVLAERRFGAARILIFKATPDFQGS